MSTRYQALNLGARDFLTKPFDHVEVLKRIQNTLQVQQRMNKHTERADVLQNLVAEPHGGPGTLVSPGSRHRSAQSPGHS